MMLLFYIIIYAIGYVVSLVLMHKYKKELDIDSYDPPHPQDYDDWSSNAVAYAVISLTWFVFWFFQLVFFIYENLVKLSINIEIMVKQYNIIEKDAAKKTKIKTLKTEIEELKRRIEDLRDGKDI